MSQFANHKYIALETFRRNGKGVSTPVWFVEYGGKLYVWTIGNSGKARRIRRNSRVRVVPASARGKPRAEWLEGNARVLEGETSAQIVDLLRKKYGLQFWIMSRLHGTGRVIIEIELSH